MNRTYVPAKMKTGNVSRERHASGKNRSHTERNVTPSLRSSDHPNAERIRPPDARTVPYWKPCRGPQLYPTATAWVRDLTEEGIEPHPDPRYLSKNVNSVQGDGKLFQMLHSIQREHTRTPITAVFVQDHMQPCTGCNRAALLCSTACRRVSQRSTARSTRARSSCVRSYSSAHSPARPRPSLSAADT